MVQEVCNADSNSYLHQDPLAFISHDCVQSKEPGVSSPLKAQLKAEAQRLGFYDLRCTNVLDEGDAAKFLNKFLANGHHGDMQWMATHAERRSSPKALWPEARSAVLLAMSYTPDDDPLPALKETDHGVISVYAQGKDYHDVIKPKLKQLARTLQGMTNCDVKVFIDTAPLMEKPLAQNAGLGWQGKHTNLVARTGGSWFFIGAILTTADLEPDTREVDHCGGCSRCLDICPTNAFPKPYQLDARRCISYLTIEHQGHIAPEFRKAMGNRIYGCDDCLAVCPWNKFAVAARETRLKPRKETQNPPLDVLLNLNEDAFRAHFKGTPVKRTGRNRMMRNILIAAGNSGDRSLLPQIKSHLSDASALVRAMAVWAYSQIEDVSEVQAHYQEVGHLEHDEDVLGEWRRALAVPAGGLPTTRATQSKQV